MKCPKCGSDDDKVLDSRSVRDGAAIRRRRECTVCGARFTTHEEIDRDEVTVVKQDGTREPFSRQKLEKGVRIACQKRPVSEDQLQSLLDSVVASLEGEDWTRWRISASPPSTGALLTSTSSFPRSRKWSRSENLKIVNRKQLARHGIFNHLTF